MRFQLRHGARRRLVAGSRRLVTAPANASLEPQLFFEGLLPLLEIALALRLGFLIVRFPVLLQRLGLGAVAREFVVLRRGLGLTLLGVLVAQLAGASGRSPFSIVRFDV